MKNKRSFLGMVKWTKIEVGEDSIKNQKINKIEIEEEWKKK